MWLSPPHKGSYDDNCQWPMNIPFRCIKLFVCWSMDLLKFFDYGMYLKQMHLLSFHKLHFRISCFGWSWNGHGHGIHGALKNKMFATTYMLHTILPSLLLRLKGFDWAQNKRKSSIRTLVNFTLLLIWVVCVVGRLKDELNTNIELIPH